MGGVERGGRRKVRSDRANLRRMDTILLQFFISDVNSVL